MIAWLKEVEYSNRLEIEQPRLLYALYTRGIGIDWKTGVQVIIGLG